MAYTTLTEILKHISEDEVVRLTDETGTGEIDEAKVTAAIETADIEIDAWIGEQYDLPLADPPPVLGKLSVDLAIHNLYLLGQGGPPESRDKQAENARKMLDYISRGKITLGVGDPAADASTNQVTVEASDRIFSRDSLRGF